MRITRLTVLGAMVLVFGCGGPLPTTGAATGAPAAIAQVRLFTTSGTDLTVHTDLPDDQSVRLEARLYAPDGHRLRDRWRCDDGPAIQSRIACNFRPRSERAARAHCDGARACRHRGNANGGPVL